MLKRRPKVLVDIPVELRSIIKIPITCTPNTSILDARDMLLRHRIGRLVVEFGKKPVGIVTEKDIAKSVSFFGGKPIAKILIQDIMSKDLITVLPDASIQECAKKMIDNNISSVVVQDKKKKLVGVVTKTDLVSTFLVQSTASLRISKIMTRKVITASPNDSIFEVESSLFNNKISRIVVTEKKQPVGIITFRDFVPAKTFDVHKEFLNPAEREEISFNPRLNEFNVNRLSYLLTFAARDIMTKDPYTVGPDDVVYTAAIIMIRHGISGIPVVRKKKLVGLVTKTDIVNVLAKKGRV